MSAMWRAAFPLRRPSIISFMMTLRRPAIFRWRSHAHLLFSNWLNYYVYQATPYDLKDL